MFIFQLILIQIIIFGTLIFILRTFLTGHITSAVSRLQNLSNANLKKETQLQKELQKTEFECKSKIRNVNEQIRRMKLQVEKELDKIKEEASSEAKREAEKIIIEAKQNARRMKETIFTQMKEEAIKLAIDVIRDIFTTQIREAIHRQFIDELIEEISDLDSGRIEFNTDTAEVVSASALEKSQKETLAKVLESKVGSPVKIEDKIDPDVAAGIVIKFGNLIIDGSLANRLKKAEEHLRQK